MRSSLLSPGHQPGSLQRLLYPAVAQPDAFLFPQLLVKMPHVEVEVPLLVQRQHSLGRLHRYPVVAAFPPPLIVQPVVAMFLVALPHPLHIAHTHPGDLGRLDPGQRLPHGLQNHVL